MNTRVVVFSPEAEEELAALYRYIAAAASPSIAADYTDAIVTHCQSLRRFPARGTRRDDIRPGLRISNYRKRVIIAFVIEPDRVLILGIFSGGRDYETVLDTGDS